jgi:flagellar motor switch protein FliM
MSDVLSQSEIDALLAAMAAGEASEEVSDKPSKEAESTPSVLLEEQLKFLEKDIQMLEYIHKEYAEVLSLSLFRNIQVKVSLESIQEISYEEFRHSIPCPAVITVFKLSPLEGYLLFQTSPDFVSKISNVCPDKDGDQKQELLGNLESDKNIFIKVTEMFIKHLEKPWGTALAVTSEVEYVETDPTNIELLFANESVVLLSLSVTLNEFTSFFNICIPYSSVEKYLGKLEITPVFPMMETSIFLENARVNIKAVLADINLSLGELIGLQKGMILNTYKPYKNKVAILVEGKHCFDGEAGLLHNRKAVKIKNCLDKDVQR